MNRELMVVTPPEVILPPSGNGSPLFIHRDAIASIAKALLLALNGKPEADGVAMLAVALGCEVKR